MMAFDIIALLLILINFVLYIKRKNYDAAIAWFCASLLALLNIKW